MIPQKEDIRAAVLYLRSHSKKVTGLMGHSKAGTGVILYAAAYDDIPRVVNVAGRFDNMRGEHHWPRFPDPCPLYTCKPGVPCLSQVLGPSFTELQHNQDMGNSLVRSAKSIIAWIVMQPRYVVRLLSDAG